MLFMGQEQSGGEEVKGGRRVGKEVTAPQYPSYAPPSHYPPPKNTLTPPPEGEEEAAGPQTTQTDRYYRQASSLRANLKN